jgi:Cys-tRNA(Pro)/Cys-tRNA(Cys) deacylase
MRVLEGRKIQYEVVEYDGDLRNAEEIALEVGEKASNVFKTLVVTRQSGKPFLVMVAADEQLDLKKLARAVSEKKVSMASHQQAEQLTGLQVGGISALALLNRGFVICADESMADREWVLVSAGMRGIQLKLKATDLIRVTGARLIPATS